MAKLADWLKKTDAYICFQCSYIPLVEHNLPVDNLWPPLEAKREVFDLPQAYAVNKASARGVRHTGVNQPSPVTISPL